VAQEIEIAKQVQARLFPQIRIRRALPASATGRRRLLRLSRSRPAEARPRHRRCLGQRNRRRSSHGQPPSQPA
jgi:hypothetical protein